MQSKGIIRAVAILIALACIWQLSFTYVARHYDNKALEESRAKAEAEFAASFVTDSAEALLPGKHLYFPGNEAFIIDTLAAAYQREYVQNINKEDVYFSYTYGDVKQRELNLGLDLKGGMNITLELQIEDILVGLAGGNAKTNLSFQAAVEAGRKAARSGEDFIPAFAEAWNKNKKEGEKLSSIFSGKDVTLLNKTDEEVLTALAEKAESAIKSAHNIFENRVKRFGVNQPNIQNVGNSGRILIELPGVKEPERVQNILRGTASLEFWETLDGSDIIAGFAEADQYLVDNPLNNEDLQEGDRPLSSLIYIPEGGVYGACVGYATAADTARVSRYINYLQDRGAVSEWPESFVGRWEVKPEERVSTTRDYFGLVALDVNPEHIAPLDGSVITSASVETDRHGEIGVSMNMNAAGTQRWGVLTGNNVGKQIAVVLDDLVYSYPNVNEAITGGQSRITGNFTMNEAQDLANVLQSGTLPARANVIHSAVVGPSLGQESINNGLISFLIAFGLVLLYMIFFYQGAGIIADIALLVNVLFLFGTLVSFNLVLTLPGIAGLVLTLGMAVDANVIIYERIKEELAAGKGLGKAVADGYKNAYSAIIDGQVTTLLTGIILFLFGGSGPVAGFATTLIIGIVTSVVTSIFITRIIIDDRLVRGRNITFENKLTKNFLKNTKVDFVSKRKFSYIFSGILIVIAIASISFKGFTYGVDFKGGNNFIVKFDQSVDAVKVRSAVVDAFSGYSTEVKEYGGDSQLRITTLYGLNAEEGDRDAKDILFEAVKPFYVNSDITFDQFVNVDENPLGIVTSEMVGPSIAEETTRNAIISVILALIVIFCYIAFRFKGVAWGVGGVTSLAHTAIIIIGFFSLFTGILPFNLDVDQTFIAAILTIIGYAINDNVVIFDRIRENKMLHPSADFAETVNTSLNATLTRTVNTSVSTLLPMVAIAIWGGESIRGLSVALILGILIGTYASIMIGTPIMFDSTKKAAAKK